MQDLFVPYTCSLKLKSIGFDEPCLGLYREDGSFLYADVFSFREPYSPSEFKEGVDEGVYYINSQILEELVTVPTFSQAFRWFREKYSLHNGIYPYYDEYEFQIKDFRLPTNTPINGGLMSYEEAELACLNKLIEVCENPLKNHT